MVRLRMRLHRERAVMEDERDAGAELHGDGPGGGIAAAGDEDHAHAGRARRRHRLQRPRRDPLVAAEQGAVDVEGEQPDARGQRPVQASTFSITSPGRILSTTSMPEATHPKTV